ncbi:MAG: bifunctional diguanylate cyclase/phosphodiesterase [Rhodocyclaceae bacterium]|nr:MAG: bifunctional diguanylate cyclase/phosphodiesterase [Rhodocyclaceae bacterium]
MPAIRPLKSLSTVPRRALAWIFLAASVLGLGLSGFIASSSRDVLKASTPLIREKLPLLEDIGQVERSLLAIQVNNHQYFAYSIPRAVYLERRAQLHETLEGSLARLGVAFPENQRLDKIRDVYRNSYQLGPRLDQLMEKSPSDKADLDDVRAVLVEMAIDANEINGQLTELRKHVEQSVLEAGAATEDSISRVAFLVTGYSVLIFLIALLVAYHIRARARAEDELAYNASHDVVTGQFNRRALEARINALAGQEQILVVIAVERFHRLVGTLGHEVADTALQAIAERILTHTEALHPELYRLDGANFALLYAPGRQTAEMDVALILEATVKPFNVGDYELLVSVSCGSARYPADGGNAVMLTRNANAALQQAKRSGKEFAAYTAALHEHSEQRLAMEVALRKAAAQDELELHYQPQLSIVDDRIIGAEALVRWRRDGKLVSPAEFIPIAEETGMIVEIGEWVLREACRQTVAWWRNGLGNPVVAVNISARQFQDPDFFAMIQRALTDTGARPEMMELEITESAIMHDPEGVVLELERLRALGFALAIDDFGTGYSSLAYLKRFPLDKLKVDQSFVRPLEANSPKEDKAIVSAVVQLGKTLNLHVIAEGVETEEQRDLLKQLGCDEIQGYWFSRPLPATAATEFLEKRMGDTVPAQ